MPSADIQHFQSAHNHLDHGTVHAKAALSGERRLTTLAAASPFAFLISSHTKYMVQFYVAANSLANTTTDPHLEQVCGDSRI
jgi:hypothetical protein